MKLKEFKLKECTHKMKEWTHKIKEWTMKSYLLIKNDVTCVILPPSTKIMEKQIGAPWSVTTLSKSPIPSTVS